MSGHNNLRLTVLSEELNGQGNVKRTIKHFSEESNTKDPVKTCGVFMDGILALKHSADDMEIHLSELSELPIANTKDVRETDEYKALEAAFNELNGNVELLEGIVKEKDMAILKEKEATQAVQKLFDEYKKANPEKKK